MKTIIILSIIALAIILLVLIKYIRKKNRERIQKLNVVLGVAKEKEAQIYFYLKANETKFYTDESIKKIDDLKVNIDAITKQIEEIDEAYSKKNTKESVDKVIDDAKAKAGPYVDLFGLQEQTARTFGELIVTTKGFGLKLKCLELLIKMKIRLPDQVFNNILPCFKEDAELVKKCEAFLIAELDFYQKAKSVKYFDICIEMRAVIVESILKSIKSDTVTSMKIEFAPFIETA